MGLFPRIYVTNELANSPEVRGPAAMVGVDGSAPGGGPRAQQRGMHSPPYHSVVVVGAGVAGLTAAGALQAAFPDLLLLEASARLGGRILQASLPFSAETPSDILWLARASARSCWHLDTSCGKSDSITLWSTRSTG